MLTYLQCCDLLQNQYDGVSGVFDFSDTTKDGPVSYALKFEPDCTVVAFEGSHDIQDWISNFQANMIFVRQLGGIDAGFYDGLPEVYGATLPKLPRDKPVYCIGHSRGGAHAQIFAAMLVKAGFTVIIITFGCPRPGDADLANILRGCSNISYRNYRSFTDQDFVCDVPVPTLDWRYVHPVEPILIDVEPKAGDPWFILARHHLFLYRQALVERQNGQTSN